MKILIHSTTLDGEPLQADSIALNGKNCAFCFNFPEHTEDVIPGGCGDGKVCLTLHDFHQLSAVFTG
jgi:hypothetical protein